MSQTPTDPSPVLFHVGYHKTATTWMQARLFQPAYGYRQVASHEDVFRHVVSPHGLYFDAAEMRGLLAERLEGCGEVPVVSSEIMIGHPFYGGHGSDVYAERIKAICPNARILVSIRRQASILPSVYMQYLLRGGTQSVEAFFTGKQDIGYFGFDPLHFAYDRLIGRYMELFGAENVLVVTQEALRDDMQEVSRTIARFSGNTAFDRLSDTDTRVQSPSYPEYAIPLLRRINHFQHSTLNPRPVVSFGRTPYGLYKIAGFLTKRPLVGRMMKTHRPATHFVRKTFSGYYDDSNARLRALLGDRPDLAGYDF